MFYVQVSGPKRWTLGTSSEGTQGDDAAGTLPLPSLLNIWSFFLLLTQFFNAPSGGGVRGQAVGIISFLSPRGVQGSKSSARGW